MLPRWKILVLSGRHLLKNSPTKKTTPTRYFVQVEIICIFFFPGCCLAHFLQYIHTKG